MKTIMQGFFSLFLLHACTPAQDLEQADTQVELTLLQLNDWDYAQDLLIQINSHRTSLGKLEIVMDSSYASAYAISHSQYMISEQTVSHDNFFTRKEALVTRGANAVTEIIGYGYHSSQSVMNAWLASPSHKNAVESDYTHVGLGILHNQENDTYCTLIFFN